MAASPAAESFDAAAALAEHAAGTRFEDLSGEAVLRAKTFLLDSIGVGVAGSSVPAAAILKRAAAGWGAGEEATVLGTGERLPASSAALVNAFQVHALEYDCVHEGAVVHAMATALPALLAFAERASAAGRPVSGEAFLAALAVGVDVATTLGLSAEGPMSFFRPATCGGFGATAALCSAAGADAGVVRDAFGILYGATSGTMQPHLEGSPVLALQMGYNARAAVQAADLALAGFTGPRDVLTGRYGFFRLFENDACDLAWPFECLGRRWRIAELSHKPIPTGRLTHGVVDALHRLVEDEHVEPADIEHVRALVPPLVHRLVGRPDVPEPDAAYARLCLPFVAGVFLARGQVDVPDFADAATLADPAVHAFAARVEVVRDDNPDPNAIDPQSFLVRLKDGRRREIVLERVFGHPDAPLSREDNLDKFLRCCGFGAPPLPRGRADALVALVERLEAETDAAALGPLAAAA